MDISQNPVRLPPSTVRSPDWPAPCRPEDRTHKSSLWFTHGYTPTPTPARAPAILGDGSGYRRSRQVRPVDASGTDDAIYAAGPRTRTRARAPPCDELRRRIFVPAILGLHGACDPTARAALPCPATLRDVYRPSLTVLPGTRTRRSASLTAWRPVAPFTPRLPSQRSSGLQTGLEERWHPRVATMVAPSPGWRRSLGCQRRWPGTIDRDAWALFDSQDAWTPSICRRVRRSHFFSSNQHPGGEIFTLTTVAPVAVTQLEWGRVRVMTWTTDWWVGEEKMHLWGTTMKHPREEEGVRGVHHTEGLKMEASIMRS